MTPKVTLIRGSEGRGDPCEKVIVAITVTDIIIIMIIYHDFLPTPRRVSHVKSGKTHTQSSRYTS